MILRLDCGNVNTLDKLVQICYSIISTTSGFYNTFYNGGAMSKILIKDGSIFLETNITNEELQYINCVDSAQVSSEGIAYFNIEDMIYCAIITKNLPMLKYLLDLYIDTMSEAKDLVLDSFLHKTAYTNDLRH